MSPRRRRWAAPLLAGLIIAGVAAACGAGDSGGTVQAPTTQASP